MAIIFPDGTQNFPGTTFRGTEHTLNGNSSVTWTGLPAGIESFTISFDSMSQSGDNRVGIRLGDTSSTGYYSSAYQSVATHINWGGGTGGTDQSGYFEIYGPGRNYIFYGSARFYLNNDGQADVWVMEATGGHQAANHAWMGAGRKSLAANHTLDSVQLFTTSGQFDAGTATLQYSF